jgi:hypothetical protein
VGLRFEQPVQKGVDKKELMMAALVRMPLMGNPFSSESEHVSIALEVQNGRVQEAVRDPAGKFRVFCQNYMGKHAIHQDVGNVCSGIATFARGRLLTCEDFKGSYLADGCWAEALPREIASFSISERGVHEILTNLAKHTRFLDPSVDEETSLGREDLFLFFITSESFLRTMNIDARPSVAYLRDEEEPEGAGLALCRHAATGDELLTEIVLKRLPASLNLGYLALAKACAEKGGHEAVVSLLDADLNHCCSSTRHKRMWSNIKGPLVPRLLALALAVSVAANMVFSG